MKFILFRHAHKGLTPFDDPELSTQGLEQSLLILDLIKNNILPTPTQLLVSPKKRTFQTFYPLSRKLSLSLEPQPELDQCNSKESRLDFKNRIAKFITKLEQNFSNEQIIFACTHYDWIEEAMTLINCDKDLNSFEFSHWAPTQFIEFDVKPEQWIFINKGCAK